MRLSIAVTMLMLLLMVETAMHAANADNVTYSVR
jgi:hypothetical protein